MNEVKSGRLLVFLDFDGVLHHTPCFVAERFCRLALLESWLRSRPRIEVVISSSWRCVYSLSELKSIFSSDLQSRVVSVTSAGSDTGGSREHQIRQWIQYEAPGVAWVAIDDSAWLFSRTERLVLCDPSRGLTSADLDEADRLLGLPPETEPPSTATVDCFPDRRSWPPLPAFNTLDELEQWLITNRPPEST